MENANYSCYAKRIGASTGKKGNSPQTGSIREDVVNDTIRNIFILIWLNDLLYK